ncbi:MAG TPA: CusA/CzcA family heavy metal efflux RND transporter [Lacibacter sp.]|nr:CusA/CzcA family heavy metal efflux RND transporter [Lacibacter sp.]
MLNAIIRFSIKNKLLVGLLVLALIGFGSFHFTKLPIDAVPDITENQVLIITQAPSLGAGDIERLITFPIEQANNNISGIKQIRSFSRFGLSLVTIVFDDATDLYWARQQVSERLIQLQNIIPPHIGKPELGPISTGLGEIYQYVIRPAKGFENKYDAVELRTIQDWIVRRQLLGVKGVAEVSSFGGKLKQFSVEVDAAKLFSYKITIDDVFDALHRNNENTGGAYIEKGPAVLYIRSEGLIQKTEDIENIAIKQTSAGTPLFLRDVADVKIGHAIRYGALCYNDEGEAAGAIVMMLKGANSSEVIKNIKKRIESIKKTLPEGIILEPFLDRTKMVNNAISTVKTNLLEGALIVVFVLVFFLGNARAGLIVASVIPLSLLFAVILMNTFGVSGNLMSLGALDFGLIVDGAVIIVEAVMHRLHHSKTFSHTNRLTQDQMNAEVSTSAQRMMNSAVFGQIIILVVYLPIFALQGIEGKMFKPMAQTVAFALLGAFVLSLTYIPMMSALFLSKKISHKHSWSDRMMNWLERYYQNALSKVLNFPKLLVGSVLALFVVSIIVLRSLGGEFIPTLEEGDFAVDTRVLTGSNLQTTIEYTQKAAGILQQRFPEVEKVVTKIGSGEVPTDPMPIEASDMMVILKPKKEWTSAKTFDELAEKMGTVLKDIPGITAGFQFPVQMRFNELMTGARQDVVCKIFGEDLDSLAAYAGDLSKIVSTVDRAQDIYVETVTGMPQIIINYNRSRIAQYKLSVADVNRVVNTAFAGQSTGMLYEGEKRFDVVVRLKGDQKKSVEDVASLLIPTPSGIQIPLHQLAEVAIKEGPNQIQREDAKRRITVGFNVRGRDVQSIVKELQQKTEQQMNFQPGYYITYGGAFENLNEAKQRLYIAVPVALLLILILLYFAFNSLKQGLLIYSAIPLSAIGGILFLALRDMPFSISAGIGFIALFGVAVLNGIVLIAEFNRQRNEGVTDPKRIVLMGTKIRLRPVLMTAAVASLGFLPMALSNGAGAEVQRPLATVVIGGLITATLLTLFVLPVLYLWFERKQHMKRNITTAVVLLGMMYCSVTAMAQTPISLPAAIDTALKNNLQVKQDRLITQYKQLQIKTAATIPQTMLNTEVGQYNSIYIDNRIGVTQSINFPNVYSTQKKLLEQEWKSSVLQVAVQEALVRRNVSILYYRLLYFREKAKLLRFADSMFTAFLKLTELRLQKGESALLEKTSAETQLLQIQIQQTLLQKDEEMVQLQFQLLLNGSAAFIPADGEWKIKSSSVPALDFSQHPAMQLLRQQQQIADAGISAEKAKLSPDLNLGLYSTTIRGIGADDKFYNVGKRFQSVQAGIGIPLFARAQKEKVNAAKFNRRLTEQFYETGLFQLQHQYKSLLTEHKKYSDMVMQLETKGLANAETIVNTADQQFRSGLINYLEWILLVNQATAIRSDYLDAVKNYNETIIQLNYYNHK